MNTPPPTQHPKEWLTPMMTTWRAQTLRIWTGRREFSRGVAHVDGWPTVTLLGRIRNEGEGASSGGARGQHWPEVYLGDGLLIRRGIEGMPYQPKTVLYAKWLSHEPVREQARLIGVSTATYWSLLDCSYFYLAGRVISLLGERDAG